MNVYRQFKKGNVDQSARGEKHFLAIEDGVRESTQSWREVLLSLKSRGLNTPKLATGDGDMGFWAALEEVFPLTRQQRCWQHKTMNVLNCLPKLSQPKAKKTLHNIWQAETKKDAGRAFDLFVEIYQPKYPKAALCLQKDRDEPPSLKWSAPMFRKAEDHFKGGGSGFLGKTGPKLFVTVIFSPETNDSIQALTTFSTPKGRLPGWLKGQAMVAFHRNILREDQEMIETQHKNLKTFGGAKYTQGPLDFIKPSMVKLMKGDKLAAKEDTFVCWL